MTITSVYMHGVIVCLPLAPKKCLSELWYLVLDFYRSFKYGLFGLLGYIMIITSLTCAICVNLIREFVHKPTQSNVCFFRFPNSRFLANSDLGMKTRHNACQIDDIGTATGYFLKRPSSHCAEQNSTELTSESFILQEPAKKWLCQRVYVWARSRLDVRCWYSHSYPWSAVLSRWAKWAAQLLLVSAYGDFM